MQIKNNITKTDPSISLFVREIVFATIDVEFPVELVMVLFVVFMIYDYTNMPGSISPPGPARFPRGRDFEKLKN